MIDFVNPIDEPSTTDCPPRRSDNMDGEGKNIMLVRLLKIGFCKLAAERQPEVMIPGSYSARLRICNPKSRDEEDSKSYWTSC